VVSQRNCTNLGNEKILGRAEVAHTFNPSTWEAEAGGVRGQPGLQSEFQDSQGYTEKPCLKKPKKKKKKKRKKEKKKRSWISCFFFLDSIGYSWYITVDIYYTYVLF
jgi:hypothetical protein